ncbi:transcriptional regulator [Microtetraspora sp. NBRC 13810]|uniref:GntR family transcriptional regulator n=1 Tax=Microtetraspora sp. NBRC 13810 TaxID=3030990 RepID=UPI0024A4B6A8|nr:GntR family transcriptional regulator [Microtetraspora sp. NBRC 13810]GLW07086.1 transcriptional regulator [Microtetraspora sp. NBRC 13810]
MSSAAIDRSSPLPFYHQLKQILLDEISGRALRPGDRLPGDHDLCQAYGVSRTVVRQALSELEYEGVIDRVKGRGTFVAQPKTSEGLVQSLTGLDEDVRARGGRLRSEVRKLEIVPADAQVASELRLEIGAPVVLLERLRFVDGEPWVLTVTHLPADLAPGLLDEDFTDQSLYALLENKYGVRLVRGRRSVEAAVAGTGLARSLGIKPGGPVLVLRSVSFTDGMAPIESFVAFHRGDRSRFEVELDRHAGAARPLMIVTR